MFYTRGCTGELSTILFIAALLLISLFACRVIEKVINIMYGHPFCEITIITHSFIRETRKSNKAERNKVFLEQHKSEAHHRVGKHLEESVQRNTLQYGFISVQY